LHALPNLQHASLTLIQEEVFVLKRKYANTGSGKRFQGPIMRAIDFSHRKIHYMVILVKIKNLKKSPQKSQNGHFLGHPVKMALLGVILCGESIACIKLSLEVIFTECLKK
jgi:hypothetical protein